MTPPDRRWAPVGRRAHRWIRRTTVAAVGLLAVVGLTGGAESVGLAWSDTPGPVIVGPPGGGPGGPGGAAGGTTGDSAATVVGEPPTRVRIPAIRVDSPLDTLGLDAGGVLRAPTDFAHAGWYSAGTRPGDVGPAVIAGHVDSRSGPAVFFRLYQVKPGDRVQVQRGDRWLSFQVVSRARYPKDRFPSADVYGPTPDAQLRLITCGGSFDARRRSYVDNVVVYAVAVD